MNTAHKISTETFRGWFKANLADSSADIASYGCDAGFPGITYTSDCVDLYNRFEDEIYDSLREEAENSGFDSVDAFTATFNRKDMLNEPNQRKTLLVWYMCERLAWEVC